MCLQLLKEYSLIFIAFVNKRINAIMNEDTNSLRENLDNLTSDQNPDSDEFVRETGEESLKGKKT